MRNCGKLQEMNFDNKIISVIKSLYEDQQSAVQLENGTTEWVPVTKGVRHSDKDAYYQLIFLVSIKK